MKTFLRIALLVLCTASARAASGPDLRLPEAPSGKPGVTGVLWDMVATEGVREDVLASVDQDQLALADTLVAVLRMTEPRLRALLPDLHVVSDFPTPGERAPDWAQIRLAGVQWLRAMLDLSDHPRDRRLQQELDQALGGMVRPQRAAMGGVVELVVLWWADRGLDPRLTHREVPLDPAAAALERADAGGSGAGLALLLAMDRDPVVRERVLSRLRPEATGWLARDFMLPLELEADSLRALGVPQRRWDADEGLMRGHSVALLRRLALDALDQTAPPVSAGTDDFTRRLARIAWWDAARYEARYWADPREAPDFGPFLTGLRVPEAEGGRSLMNWVRNVHLQTPVVQRRILEQLGGAHEPVVAELVGLAAIDRVEAIAAGFRMVYQRRPLARSEGARPVAVAIDWTAVQQLIRAMLEAITGVSPPAVFREAPDMLAAWWADWWSSQREDRRWYRGPLPEALQLPDEGPAPEFTPRRGRVD